MHCFAFEKSGHFLSVPISPVACGRDESWSHWQVTFATKESWVAWLFMNQAPRARWGVGVGCRQWLEGPFVTAVGDLHLVLEYTSTLVASCLWLSQHSAPTIDSI